MLNGTSTTRTIHHCLKPSRPHSIGGSRREQEMFLGGISAIEVQGWPSSVLVTEARSALNKDM